LRPYLHHVHVCGPPRAAGSVGGILPTLPCHGSC
jgi:hypothetical protein